MLTKQEIIDILKDDTNNEKLFLKADKLRQEHVGDEVHLRGLIEFSNICKCQCKYCGLRAPNKEVTRYRIYEDDIISYARNAADMGYKTMVLQSGEDEYFTVEKMVKIIKEIKKLGVALTLSIGEKSYDEYKAYKDAGADRYLIRIETTNPDLYAKMHPNMDFNKRIKCLYDIKSLGYETGTGCLVGLPGQTIEDLAQDILFFKEIDADMVGIGPLITHPQTPLKDENNGDFWLALKVMALTRIILPDINIPATTAMETLNPNGRIIALKSGANVVMPNVTSSEYRKKYEIYPNKICIHEEPDKCQNCISAKIKSIGRTIADNQGQSKHFLSK